MGSMKIYATKIHDRKTWVADLGRVNGKRKRRFFMTKEEAKAEIENVLEQRKTAGDVWLGLTAPERVEAATIIKEVKDRGLTLRQVWDVFLNSDKVAVQDPVTLKVAADRFYKWKEAARRRKTYMDSLKFTVDNFIKGRHEFPAHKVTGADIEAFLATRESDWSKKSAFKRLHTFFKYCVAKKICGANPVKELDTIQIDDRVPKILTVRQAARVTVATKRHFPEGLAALVLGLYAGIRPNELTGISWDDVRLDEGVVIVDAAASKTSQRRIVHLEPTALAWVKAAKEAGAMLPITPYKWSLVLGVCSRSLGWKRWESDVLRHSAASYWLAEKPDAPALAIQLGNSVQVLYKHYREVVTRKDAARFWRLVPRKFRAEACLAGSSPTPPSSSQN